MAAIFSSSQLLLLLPAVLILLLLSSPHPSAADGADQTMMRMTLVNLCNNSIAPGILANEGFPQLRGGGLRLDSGDILSFFGLSAGWSGRIWPRTNCLGWIVTVSCITGDCGPYFECAGRYGERPFTVAELAVDATGQTITYDVSLVEGYNVPMAVIAVNTQGTSCPVAGCQMDLINDGACPTEQLFSSPELMGGHLAVGCHRICPSGQSGPCEMSKRVKLQCPNLIAFKGDQPTEKTMCQSVREVQVVFCPKSMAAVPLLEQVVSSRFM